MAVVGAVLASPNHYWSSYVQIYQTILTGVGIGVTWQLAELGFVAV